MGCDIHMHVEYKDFRGDRWFCGDYFTINPYYEENNSDGELPYNLVDIYPHRNYSLFATLANVRNYGGTSYIDEPRGLPDDVCVEVKKASDRIGDYGHSRSYFTLQELIDFQNKAKPLKHRGMISPQAQINLDEKGILPDCWCQGTNEEGWQWRKWEESNKVLVSLIEIIKKRASELYVIYDFLWEREPEKAYEKSKNIRIVFWFDN